MKSRFSIILSGLRREKGLSQRTAAQGLGVSQALLSHYENDAREPKLDFVARACDYYGVSADYLLGRSEDRSFEGSVPLPCGSDGELALACELQEIFSMLRDLNDGELTESAVKYLSSASEKITGLFNDPYTPYDPMRDANMKIAEAAFLTNIRRVTGSTSK